MLYRIEQAIARSSYRLWIKFADGVQGEVDLGHLVGKGVFTAWEDPAVFDAVKVDADSGTVVWPGGLDLAPDALYREIAHAQPDRVRERLGASSETDGVDQALGILPLREELLEGIERIAGTGGVDNVFDHDREPDRDS